MLSSVPADDPGINIPHVDTKPYGPTLQPLQLTVYTRYEHGNLPVRVFQNPETGDTNYEVGFSSGKKTFSSARKMISEFYGHDVHMPFDRYFRLGKYRPQRRQATGGANLLQLLDQKNPSNPPITVHTNSEAARKPLQKTQISVSKPKSGVKTKKNSSDTEVDEFFSAMKAQMVESGAVRVEPEWTAEMDAAFEKALNLELDRIEERVGIDLAGRGHEVRKLLFAGFAGKMLSRGYDPEDVLQEVYRGLLVRNKGKCPWDKRKSSFGHYVYMVISCVLTNYHRKESKQVIRDAKPLEVRNDEGEELPSSYGSVPIHYGTELGEQMALNALQRYLMELPDTSPEAQVGRTLLPYVTLGCTRREIVAETGHKETVVSRALAWVRRQVALWATEMGMGRSVPVKYRLA
jgi:DNA-directed RNA polymerase specialized sigma24 family protein